MKTGGEGQRVCVWTDMTPRNFIAATVVCALPVLPMLHAATPTEEHIAHVENGLQKPNRLKGSPAEPMKLAERMEHYSVHGVSVAGVYAGAGGGGGGGGRSGG